MSKTVPQTRREIREHFRTSFQTNYLTITSIIQGAVFGVFVFVVATKANLELNTTKVLIVTTFILIVLTWHEYMHGATAYRWAPSLVDSFIPFSLGASQVWIIFSLDSCASDAMWYRAVSVFSLLGSAAYFNMHYRASQENDMGTILKRLTCQKGFATCSTFIIFVTFFLVSLAVKEKAISDIGAAWFAFAISIAYVVRTYLYWRRIFRISAARHVK